MTPKRVLLDVNRSVRKLWQTPLLATLLANRTESVCLVGAGAVHVALNLAGLPGWVCPIRAVTGVPCPGCGLTTASVQLLHGDLAGSLHTHAFAPLFLALIALMVSALLLPDESRQKFVTSIARFEAQSGITVWLLLALFLYWGARLPGAL
jgi:hypothetical protein